MLSDDLALLGFGDRMIRQIMYGEETIPLKRDALEQHLARRGKESNRGNMMMWSVRAWRL